VEAVDNARQNADGVVVELPGGLFTPLADRICNVDLAGALKPDAVLLVAPDRLGVLHDVIATLRAASTAGVSIAGIVLVAPEQADASTTRNAGELSRTTDAAVLAVLPRASPAALSELPAMARLVEALSAATRPAD
jgi:dethiobiotin synthetase